tara:strand:+ start:436 stop:1209 length:774 start_codon:yes stop_codon:yes gene_type:complete
MANVIRHKRGTSTPSASDFSNTGEILVDTNTGNIFNKTDADSVVKVNGLNNIVEDTTPQLGGDLDMNSNSISSGVLGVKNTGSQSELRLYCEANNAHYVAIKAPPHAQFSGNHTFQLPPDGGTNNYVLKTDGSGNTSWVAQTAAYTNSSVDSHLNVSSASSGQILSWNGSDYAWVADQTGGGGSTSPGGSNTQVQFNNSGSFGGSANFTFDGTNITVAGTVSAVSSAVGTAGMRKIHASTSAPSGSDGAVGDIWVKY